jgi:hypothetical protein
MAQQSKSLKDHFTTGSKYENTSIIAEGESKMPTRGLDRRTFLQAGIGFAIASCLGFTQGCAAPAIAPSPTTGKAGGKITPPENGCLVGFYREGSFKDKMSVAETIEHYLKALDAKPFILAVLSLLDRGFPAAEAVKMKKAGITPYINIAPALEGRVHLNLNATPADIVHGRVDRNIRKLAVDALNFGRQYGSFFFTTLVEFNAKWWLWSRTPDTVAAYRCIWQMFEEQGVNQYATWVWEAFCPEKYKMSVIDPEPFYPGDRYVDWVGINVFANLKNPAIQPDTQFAEMMSDTYKQMRRNHQEKPIMVSEFGRTPGDKQRPWLTDAYARIKTDFPQLKAAIYYDNITKIYGGQDHTLDQKSLNTLKEIFKDPYWIMAKADI